MSEVNVRGWHLEMKEGIHFKFYTVLLTGSFVLIHYGRIGTKGQYKPANLPSPDKAEEVALRQVYTKAANGYTFHENNFVFLVDEAVLAASAEALANAFTSARRDDRLRGGQAAVFEYYDGIVDEAHAIIAAIKNGDELEVLITKNKGLRAMVEQVTEKQDLMKIQVSIATQMLAARVSGSA